MSTDVPVCNSTSPATSTKPPLLPDDVGVLKQMIAELLDALKKSQHERDGLQHRIDQLLRKLYGPKAERFDPNQPWLIPEMAPDAADTEAATDAPPAAAEATTTKAKRQGHGRKPLPPDLPRRREEHTLSEAERLCPCCQ